MNPLVSVIVPNYNHSVYLKQRLDSILCQTYQNFELIILDDCSTDNSKEIIDSYKDNSKISKIIFNHENSGNTFKQWEKGLEIANGEYIWIAESDDWCEPVLLETLVSGLLNNKQCSVAYAQSYAITNPNIIDWRSNHQKLFDYVNGLEYIKENMLFINSIFNASMALFKKEYYLKISNRYTSFKFCGDWFFWIELAQKGDVFISGRLLNYFRRHDQDVTGKANACGYNFIEELGILKILKNKNIINGQQYKSALLFKYFRYFIDKNKFNKNIRLEIEQAFYWNENKSYKYFLKRAINISRLKNKAGMFFNYFIKA